MRFRILEAPRKLGRGSRLVYRLPYEPPTGLLAPVTVRPSPAAVSDYRARLTEARLR